MEDSKKKKDKVVSANDSMKEVKRKKSMIQKTESMQPKIFARLSWVGKQKYEKPFGIGIFEVSIDEQKNVTMSEDTTKDIFFTNLTIHDVEIAISGSAIHYLLAINAPVEVIEKTLKTMGTVNTENIKDEIGRTPLDIASEHELPDKIKQCLWNNIWTKNTRKQYNEPFAFMALKNKRWKAFCEIFEKLREKNLLNTKNKTKFLFDAAKVGAKEEVIKIILDKNSSLCNEKEPKTERNALYYAAKANNLDTVQALLKYNTAKLSRDKYGMTALSVALASKCTYELIENIIQKFETNIMEDEKQYIFTGKKNKFNLFHWAVYVHPKFVPSGKNWHKDNHAKVMKLLIELKKKDDASNKLNTKYEKDLLKHKCSVRRRIRGYRT